MPKFPELELTNKNYFPELNEYMELTEEGRKNFIALEKDDQQKVAFTLPIPALRDFKDPYGYENSSVRVSSDSEDEPGTFKIDEERFEYEESSYEDVNLFSTPIWKKNQLSEEQFVSKYVQPYLDLHIDYKSLYSTYKIRGSSLYCQESCGSFDEESELYDILKYCLYNPVQTPLFNSVEVFKNDISKLLGTFLIDKGLIDDSLDDTTSFNPIFTDTKYSRDANYLGVLTKPSAMIAYQFSKRPCNLAYALGYIGAKLPSLKLKESYEKLCRVTEDPSICFDRYGITRGEELVWELQRLVRKYATICVHSGCDRFVITDYDSFLFVHLDKSVSLMPEDQEEADENEKEAVEAPLASTLSDKSSDHHVDEELEGAKKILKSSIKTTGPVQSNREETGEKRPASFISSRHFLVPGSHPNIRLYFMTFFTMNQERMNDIKEFQKNVIEVMHRKNDKVGKDSKGGFKSSLINRPKTRSLAAISERDFILESNVFKDEYKIDLGATYTKAIDVGTNIVSQLIKVDSKKFMDQIPSSHHFYQKNVSETSELEIFDPLWGERLKNFCVGRFTYTYHYAIKKCLRSLKIYQHLTPIMGSVVPRVYSYGRFSDFHVCSGQSYTRFWGPFIQTEHFERDETLTKDSVTKQFIEESIIPAFRSIHKCGIVHKNIRFDNIVVTTKREVRIINFGYAKHTESKTKFEHEIREIYSYFGIY